MDSKTLKGLMVHHNINNLTEAWIAYRDADKDSFERYALWMIYLNLRDGNDPTHTKIKPRRRYVDRYFTH